MNRSLLFIALMAGVSSVTPAQMPTRLSASIANGRGHTYTLELRGGQLVYSDSTPDGAAEPTAINPSPEQWREFRRALDAIKVWRWQESYKAEMPAFDTVTVWSFSVSYPDCKVASGGIDSFPDWSGFAGFEDAIEALVGGKAFRLPAHVPKR